MASRLSWFMTPRGRTFSFGFMCTASVAAFLVEYVPHNLALYKYKQIVSMHQAAVPVPLAESVMKRWTEVLTDLSLPHYEIKYLDPFTVFGFDLFHAGTTSGRWGAIIGIPINFTYKNVDTIDPSPIRINQNPVNWNRRDAKELLEALVLTEDAQCYGIAREVLMSKHNEPLLRSVLAAFMISSTYLLSFGMNNKFKLRERPLPVRGLFYLVAAAFSYSMWALQIDLLNVYREEDTDSHIAQLDDRYKKGAIEFYEKILKRNVALRTLLGPQGETVYTPKGNERFLFRQPRIPLDQRKKFFVDSVAAIKRTAETLNEEEAVAAPT